jgi:hypothetical protein
MKDRSGLRHFFIAFLLAILLYVVAFHWIEHRRGAKGPWVVSFISESGQPPSLLINQHALGITNVSVVFENARTNAFSETIRFESARSVPFLVPFGECIFLDSTFLPGTVTLRCFGHEIELIPRVLIVDHKAHAWTTARVATGGSVGGQ